MLGLLSSKYGFTGSKIISLMRGAMLWITRRLSRRSGGEYGAHNHQFITMKQKEWYSFAMLDFGSRCSSAINRRYSRCHHSFAATQASDEEARNGGGHITIFQRGERHTYPLTIEMQVQGKHLVLTSQHPGKSGKACSPWPTTSARRIEHVITISRSFVTTPELARCSDKVI
nr:uncharacterized protein LOC109754869 [Aegilops tauschii subsp. strangulata]